jgi:hypothetical protein
MAELHIQEGFGNWITAYGSKDLFPFFRCTLEYHDDRTEIHNNLIQMIDDASVQLNELEETPEQTQAAVTRLHEKPRKTNSPDTDHPIDFP